MCNYLQLTVSFYEYAKDSSKINGPLRAAGGDINKLDSIIQEKVRRLDSSISKSTTPESVYVYR
ncbi:ADP-ribosyltransferase, partial [Staphylococcus aureus]|uniref:ADP-ribosyltransferase n=1 Tax=Staphylococcus aureus TaxID=1280 RepID=UPI002AC33608